MGRMTNDGREWIFETHVDSLHSIHFAGFESGSHVVDAMRHGLLGQGVQHDELRRGEVAKVRGDLHKRAFNGRTVTVKALWRPSAVNRVAYHRHQIEHGRVC
jgi:hypothetical protein